MRAVPGEGPCFACALLAGLPRYPHHNEDDTIGFLAGCPILLGYCLVAHISVWTKMSTCPGQGHFGLRSPQPLSCPIPSSRIEGTGTAVMVLA